MNEVTTAAATGNARAQIYVAASAHSETNPFRLELTRAEEDLHFYFNDDILDIAEDYGQAVALRSRLEALNGPAANTFAASPMGGNGDISRQTREREIAHITNTVLPNLEEAMLAEIEEVTTEYINLAAALDAGRIDYVLSRL